MYDDVRAICEDFQNGKFNLEQAVVELIDVMEEQLNGELEDQQWECAQEVAHDLFYAAMTTGAPDLFSDELRSFWDRGASGNV